MNDSPSRLDRAQIVLRKWFSSEVSRRNRELFRVQRSQIFREQSHLLQLGRRSRDRFPDCRKRMEF